MQNKFSQVNTQLKTLLHTDRLGAIKNGTFCAPICLEIDVTQTCNQKCLYCYWSDFREEEKTSLTKQEIFSILEQAKEIGIKAIVWTGGGSPLCHPDIDSALIKSHHLGLQNGLLSNGMLLNKHLADIVLTCCEWARFSLSATTEETFKIVHRVDGIDRVYGNLEYFFRRVRELRPEFSAGIVFLVIKENAHEIYDAAEKAKSIGAKYFQLKPPSDCEIDLPWWKEKVIPQFKRALELKDGENFSVFSSQYTISMYGADEETRLISDAFPTLGENSERCLIHYLTQAISADGNLCYCKHFRGVKKGVVGNIREHSLKEMLSSYKYKEMCDNITRKNCGIKLCQYDNANNMLNYVLYPDPKSNPNFL